jgi:23S rRNA (uridine2552-2'-O)-methyltransferase
LREPWTADGALEKLAMKKVQDAYFKQAKKDGFAARSVYKLEEIDRKQRLLRAGQRVLDLGCAPGSWLQHAAARVGPKGRVVGVDLQAVTAALPEQVRVLQGDVFAMDDAVLREAAGLPSDASGLPSETNRRDGFDLVLSDMAPKTTGIPSADAARSAELARRALALAEQLLRPGGDALVKVFQGAEFPDVRKAYGAVFERVTIEKPAASRSESVEVFLLGRGKRAVESPTPNPPERT